MFLIQQPHTIRKGMVDCFNAFMVDGAEMSTPNDIPICYSTMQTPPKKVITYEEAKKSTDYDATVVFLKMIINLMVLKKVFGANLKNV